MLMTCEDAALLRVIAGATDLVEEGGGLELIVYYLSLSLYIARKKSLLSLIVTTH